jgi:hypothetical protein
MTICSRCPSPARWRDADGRHFCAGHVPANGKPLARLPEPDILELLDNASEGECCLFEPAAAEIRRLRALLKAAGDKSGAC